MIQGFHSRYNVKDINTRMSNYILYYVLFKGTRIVEQDYCRDHES